MNGGNSWKPIGREPYPNWGNGGDGTRPTLIMFYMDGSIETAQVFNGTNNPDFTGNFNNTPNHAPGDVMAAVLPDGTSVSDIINPANYFILSVGKGRNPNSWSPGRITAGPVPGMGNGSDGSRPTLILMYPQDGQMELATVFNGTNNPDGQGNFNEAPAHEGHNNVGAVIAVT